MKKKQNADVTDWFPGEVKPVHIGWYETPATRFNGAMRYWNGFHWRDLCMCCKSYDQNRKWRGLKTPNAIAQGREHSERPAGAEG